jgi:hypothetical protein
MDFVACEGINWTELIQDKDLIADFCENGDESLGFMKARNFSTTFWRKTLYHSVNYEQ